MRLAHILALAAVCAGASLLVARYLTAISGAAQRQRAGACIALDPQPLGVKAPDFERPDLEGVRHRLSALRGKVVMLNFWLTSCRPCVEEMPSIARLQRMLAHRRDDFALVTVSVDQEAKVVRAFLERHGFGSIPVLLDPDRKVPASFGTTKFPETYLIDRSGTIRHRFINKRDWDGPAALRCIDSLM